MALLNRLNTDRSLAAFAGQFVPVKLTTDGNPEWSKWAQQYPNQGSGIPILYVIRADGEKLYAQSGSLQGPALPQMLATTLRHSGRNFSDAETQLLESSVGDAQSALSEEDYVAAGKSLGRLEKLGTLGDLKSFSELAVQADALAQQVVENAKQSITEAKGKLDDPQTALDGVLTLVEAEAAYAGFPELKSELVAEIRAVSRNDSLKEALRQAQNLQRARRYAESDKGAVRLRAEDAYEQVITRFPGTPVAAIARNELAAIAPDATILKAPAEGPTPQEPQEPQRTWSDRTGEFRIEAKYVQQKQGFVQLQKRDGTLLAVPISNLSDADQTYLKDR